jgi:hypothetical protein
MEELVRTEERILSGPLGRDAALRPERVWGGDKSTVLRCGLWDDAPPTPPSVIVKRSKHGAILEDWAASLFLEQVPHEPPLAPRCYGGDLPAQVFVPEGLGDGGPGGSSYARMRAANPAVIPRNHRVGEALSAAEDHDDLSVPHRLLAALASPYERGPDSAPYQGPLPDDCSYRTFCGT